MPETIPAAPAYGPATGQLPDDSTLLAEARVLRVQPDDVVVLEEAELTIVRAEEPAQ